MQFEYPSEGHVVIPADKQEQRSRANNADSTDVNDKT